MKTVIYPIANGNYKDSNAELVLSLRSLHAHLKCDFEVIIISEREPMYLSDQVKYAECKSYRHALELACTLADEFLWMNDDIMFLRDYSWESLRCWARGPEKNKDQIKTMCEGTGWSRRKGHVLAWCGENGYSTYDFSTHLPYMYETCHLRKILENEELDFGYKTPVETAYGNIVDVESRCCEKLSRHHDRHLPVDPTKYDFLNYSDAADLPHVRGFLLGMFPNPCPFEDYGSLDLSTFTLDQIK